MKKLALLTLLVFPLVLSAQFFSGYYVSLPAVEDFHHFKIKHHSEHEGKYEGTFSLKAYIGKDVVWEQKAVTIHGEEAEDFIRRYGEGKDILSVHKLKMMWDGNEWEFFFLGYLDKKNHGRFIVVEEIFNDETETELLKVEKFYWNKGHHLDSSMSLSSLN